MKEDRPAMEENGLDLAAATRPAARAPRPPPGDLLAG